jgi:hypothetical protein
MGMLIAIIVRDRLRLRRAQDRGAVDPALFPFRRSGAGAEATVKYSKGNMEDWDFRNANIGSPNYDVEADLFLGRNFTTVVAVDALRLDVLSAFIDKGVAKEPDGEHVRFEGNGDGYLAGWKSGTSRLTSEGRFERKVVEALRRENRKYGRLRFTILPPMPGVGGTDAPDP